MAKVCVVDQSKLAKGISDLMSQLERTFDRKHFCNMNVETYGNAIMITAYADETDERLTSTGLVNPDEDGFLAYQLADVDEQKRMVKALAQYGCPQINIATFMDISQSTVSNILNEDKKGNTKKVKAE